MKIKKKDVVIFISIFLLFLLIVSGTYAYWIWNSEENKNVVFNSRVRRTQFTFSKKTIHLNIRCVGWGNEQGFIIGVNHKTGFAFVWFFHKLAFAIIHGDFVASPAVGIVGTNLRGKQ